MSAVFPDVGIVDAQTLAVNDFGDYLGSLHSIARGRRPFLTAAGDLAIGPGETRDGDFVAIVLGSDVPYVLRRRSGGEGFLFVGEAFLYDCMDGQKAGPDATVEHIEIY